jgi:hypothetical protein
MVGVHLYDIVPLLLFVAPWIVAFVWVRPDADRRGQPGLLWALLALPLSWLAILAYVVVRAISDGLRSA